MFEYLKRHKSLFTGPLLALTLAFVWVLSVSFKWPMIRARTSTVEIINGLDNLVQAHISERKKPPQSLNQLRLFALEKDAHYSFYDTWGQRIEYLPLGQMNYLIRSFGDDGFQNRANRAPDLGVFQLGENVQLGLKYDDQAGVMHPRPSAILFAGADDQTNRCHARLFIDAETGERRLVVKDRERKNFIMVAPHDQIEEFLWVPGQMRIVFTAAQSARYSDGLYVWDLRADQAFNLFSLEADSQDLEPSLKQKSMYLALSSVSASKPPQVAVFAAPASQVLLDPRKFFSSSNLHIFTIGEPARHVKASGEVFGRGDFHNTDFLGSLTITPGGEGASIQKAWLSLPQGGDFEKGLLAWQDFSSRFAKTVMAPYAILGAAMFYQDAAKHAGIKSRESQILLSYSAELGGALSKMITAPGYVRGVGAWIASGS